MPPIVGRSHKPTHAAVAALASVAALAAAPAAQAHTGTHPAGTRHAGAHQPGTHRCTPASPEFTSLIASAGVPCTEARRLNKYMMTHETLSAAFRMHGKTWRGKVYARSAHRTAMVYRHGIQKVWLTFDGAAS